MNELNLSIPEDVTLNDLIPPIQEVLQHINSPLSGLFHMGLPAEAALRAFVGSQHMGTSIFRPIVITALKNVCTNNGLNFVHDKAAYVFRISPQVKPSFKVTVKQSHGTTIVFRITSTVLATAHSIPNPGPTDLSNLIQYHIVAKGIVRPGYDFGVVTSNRPSPTTLSITFRDVFDADSIAEGLHEFLTQACIDKGSPLRKRTKDRLFTISQQSADFLSLLEEVVISDS